MHIYTVTFEKYPNLVKIGYSIAPNRRLQELSRSHGAYTKVSVYGGSLAKHAERILHKKLGKWNVPVNGDGGTEFFNNQFCEEAFKQVLDVCELKQDKHFNITCPLLDHLEQRTNQILIQKVSSRRVHREVVRHKGKFNKNKLSHRLDKFVCDLEKALNTTKTCTEPSGVYYEGRNDRAWLSLNFYGDVGHIFGAIPLIYDCEVGASSEYINVYNGGSTHYDNGTVEVESWSIRRRESFSHIVDSVAQSQSEDIKEILMKYKHRVNSLLEHLEGYNSPVYDTEYRKLEECTTFVPLINVDKIGGI